MIRPILTALALLGAPVAQSATCEDRTWEGIPMTICDVNASAGTLRLFLNDSDDKPYGTFSRVAGALAAQGERLDFAMNAGMYHADRTPVGYYTEDGTAQSTLLTGSSPGNFGLLPNGVFCIRPERADVIETLRFQADAPPCRYATQSGPMLVIDGKLHPRFLVNSNSRYIRNGVGTSADGTRAVFAIANRPVTFHQFGRFFRDALNLPQALYFDGNISKLYAPQLGRSDLGRPMGPIVGSVSASD